MAKRGAPRSSVHVGTGAETEAFAAALRASGIDASTEAAGSNPPLFDLTGTAGWRQLSVPRRQARQARRILRSAGRQRSRFEYRRRFGLSPYQAHRGAVVAQIIGIALVAGSALVVLVAILSTR